MKPYFIAENSGVTYTIQTERPNWILVVLTFHNEIEIEQSHRRMFSKAIIVLMNKVQNVKNVAYKYRFSSFTRLVREQFKHLIKEIEITLLYFIFEVVFNQPKMRQLYTPYQYFLPVTDINFIFSLFPLLILQSKKCLQYKACCISLIFSIPVPEIYKKHYFLNL